MSAYVASARIDRVAPRLVIGHAEDRDADAWAPIPLRPEDPVVDLAASDADDPLVDLVTTARERWSQLTFYLFDAEGWR
jgi:hypothetical protein